MEISELIGKTIVEIQKGNDRTDFKCSDGSAYAMYHNQDCCESVSIEDVIGDLSDLLNNPIILAEESTSSESPEGKPSDSESQTWTFYKLATVKGYVTIRWWGTSNGYYSESVDFEKVGYAN